MIWALGAWKGIESVGTVEFDSTDSTASLLPIQERRWFMDVPSSITSWHFPDKRFRKKVLVDLIKQIGRAWRVWRSWRAGSCQWQGHFVLVLRDDTSTHRQWSKWMRRKISSITWFSQGFCYGQVRNKSVDLHKYLTGTSTYSLTLPDRRLWGLILYDKQYATLYPMLSYSQCH